MLRLCATCQQQRPLREFDLGGGQLSTTCLGCAHEKLLTEDERARFQRTSQIAALERRRRELIAALVKIDAEIADLRARPTPVSLVFVNGGEGTDSDFGDDAFGGGDLSERDIS